MKNQSSKFEQNLTGLVFALFFLCSAQFVHGQCEGTPNPMFPGCQAPGGTLKVLLVLDESGSIGRAPGGFEDEVEAAVTSFANALKTGTTGLGKLQMGIVDFSTEAATTIGLPLTDVKELTFSNKVTSYLTSGYIPVGPQTNFEAALNKAKSIAGVNFIFFITDGNPNGGAGINVWKGIANSIKSSGTYIFGLAIGSGIDDCNIIALSGPDELNNPLAFGNGADWTSTNFNLLGADLISFANSLIDTQAPVLNCSPNIRTNNELGKCGKTVQYTTTVTDNCPNITSSCTPPAGSFFNVGQTTVNCTARDNVGNAANCSFVVTILDLEAPKIICPADKLISCEESIAPANTGNPITSDNCGVGAITNTDLRVDGACPNEFTLERTWNVMDVNGNNSNCLQIISVEDKKSPVITCPANITVTCDTSVAKTGLAIATDNCDASVSLSRRDIFISGDCDWFCITERHWKATDDCRNTSKCIQVITKDVSPLIEQALAAGALKWGQNAATVTLPPSKGSCVIKWLPYAGATPAALKFDDAVAGADCKLMTNPMDPVTGQIMNPLLGEAMKLKILVRLKPSLGTTKLSAIPCEMHFIVRQALANNPDVNELLRVTDLTLGNINVNLLVPEHAMHLLNVLKCVNAGRSVCNP